ncbi:hypothetical protein M3J09_004031 [Ascochyta lentis]
MQRSYATAKHDRFSWQTYPFASMLMACLLCLLLLHGAEKHRASFAGPDRTAETSNRQ